MTDNAGARIMGRHGSNEAELSRTVDARRPHHLQMNRNMIAGAVIVFAILLIAILAPLIAPYGSLETNYNARFVPPSNGHWFGTDDLGRDILSRVVFGARIDLRIGILSVIFPFVFGVMLGCIAGYYGGKADTAIMRVVDVVQAFPFLILIIAIIAVLGPGLKNIYIAVAIVAWVTYARLLRGEILVAKHREYVEAARSMGARDVRVIGKHILPNVISTALVYAMSDIILYIVLAASLSYLGLGARPPDPEWGAMITAARTFWVTAWWMSVFPGLAIVVTGIGFSLFGDGLADSLRRGRK